MDGAKKRAKYMESTPQPVETELMLLASTVNNIGEPPPTPITLTSVKPHDYGKGYYKLLEMLQRRYIDHSFSLPPQLTTPLID